jgi:hypothetical protein
MIATVLREFLKRRPTGNGRRPWERAPSCPIDAKVSLPAIRDGLVFERRKPPKGKENGGDDWWTS